MQKLTLTWPGKNASLFVRKTEFSPRVNCRLRHAKKDLTPVPVKLLRNVRTSPRHFQQGRTDGRTDRQTCF